MLKASQHGQYFKNGRKIITYIVTGPALEIAEYKAITSLQLNRPEDQLPNVNGNPLLFVVEEQEFAAGRAPQPSYALIKSHDGLRFIRDTSAQDKALYAGLQDRILDKMADKLAERRLAPQGQRTPRPVTTPTAAPSSAPADVADMIAGQVDEGENAVVQQAGTEALTD